MLRRKQSIDLRADTDTDTDAWATDSDSVQPKLSSERIARLRAEAAQPTPQKIERQSLDDLRAELERTLIPAEEQARSGRRAFGGQIRFSRVLLLIVALAAGGVAAYLATHGAEPAPVAAPEVAAPAAADVPPPVTTTKVLVATQAVKLGQKITAQSVEWQTWPLDSVRPEYIVDTAQPEAITDMDGAVAKAEIYVGEPIREEKLARDARSTLSAVLADGKRGVSVSVSAESASGGFVAPGDHVDLVLTKALTEGGQSSEVILANVRVLAVNAQIDGQPPASGDAKAEDQSPTTFSNVAIATLELDPAQAQVVINASGLGRMSLVLRSVSNFTDASAAGSSSINQTIRMTSPFWRN